MTGKQKKEIDIFLNRLLSQLKTQPHIEPSLIRYLALQQIRSRYSIIVYSEYAFWNGYFENRMKVWNIPWQ